MCVYILCLTSIKCICLCVCISLSFFSFHLLHQSHFLLWYNRHASLVAQTVRHLPAMWETRIRFLGREDPLEKEMAIHSSTLAWKIPWTEEPDRLQSMGSQRIGHDRTLHFTLDVGQLFTICCYTQRTGYKIIHTV